MHKKLIIGLVLGFGAGIFACNYELTRNVFISKYTKNSIKNNWKIK